jgi:hypothetical protein
MDPTLFPFIVLAGHTGVWEHYIFLVLDINLLARKTARVGFSPLLAIEDDERSGVFGFMIT